MDSTSESARPRLTPQLVLGVCIVLVGVVFTLDNLGLAYAEDYLRFWPVGLIAIGLVKLWQGGSGQRGAFGGFVFVGIGALLLLDALGIVRVRIDQLWPMLLVFFGASMVWRGMHGSRPRTLDGSDTISGIAILGGVKRGTNSNAFKGGDLTAIMGGCEIDLRRSAINGDATLDLFAMWGGIDIKVPEDWTIVNRVVPLLGAVEDKTHPALGAATHRLVLRGFAIMGGIEIKN